MVMQRPIRQADAEAYSDFLADKLGIRIVAKEDSKLMRVFAVFVQLFNKEFMERYITTIGSSVYWPRLGRFGKNANNDISVLFHEGQHAWDFKHHPLRMWLGYIFPQLLVLLTVLAVLAAWLSNWWLLCLLCVVMIAPIPAPFRLWSEQRGYSCTIAFRIWSGGDTNSGFFDYIAHQFTGSHYYYMWPWHRDMMKRLAATEQRIRRGELTEVQRLTYEFLQQRGILGS